MITLGLRLTPLIMSCVSISTLRNVTPCLTNSKTSVSIKLHYTSPMQFAKQIDHVEEIELCKKAQQGGDDGERAKSVVVNANLGLVITSQRRIITRTINIPLTISSKKECLVSFVQSKSSIQQKVVGSQLILITGSMLSSTQVQE